ncbi:class IV lanthionine synthetase LanL [Archangium sp.]|uniref:class IV lanthionine synthetase LanL n=1 Tax=Archangium sp. TaxID=1872627 RepID=UPI002D65E00F|nr:class IV lanthionine synthetase LanL [Archangium sp.]HYO54474.1 class IV lanthionine synthetase LanL [Archangium sp.]
MLSPPLVPFAAGRPRAGSFLDILQHACDQLGVREAGWRLVPQPVSPEPWLQVRCRRASPPRQGWKLHLSASTLSAEELLRRVLPELLAEDASFKVAASLRDLARLNQGEGGESQVGKFITVYPNDETQAVRMAVRLDEVTRGLCGPAISSDRPLRPGSRVFYRYGAFDGRYLQTPAGELFGALEAPDGTLVMDRRGEYTVPSWAVDPFLTEGVAVELPPPSPLIAGRYVVTAMLHQSPCSTVFLALDLDGARRCVLKRVSRTDDRMDGYLASERLHHEAAVLELLDPEPWFPKLYQLFEDGDFAWLAMEDIAGDTLHTLTRALAASGRLPPLERTLSWSRQLAAALEALHARGLVHGDLNSKNVLVTHEGRLRLIDLELAHGPSVPLPPGLGQGTRGYVSPQQMAGAPGTVLDDIHGFGALLYLFATGAEPFHGPGGSLLKRPIHVMNPSVPAALAEVIARCLAPEPGQRFGSIRDVEVSLARIEPRAPGPLAGSPRRSSNAQEAIECSSHYLALARRLGDSLVRRSTPAPEGRGTRWLNTHPRNGGFPSLDLNGGCAGIALTLAGLVAVLGEPRHRATLAEAARWLCHAPRPEGYRCSGLYVGEAGVGTTLLRAGQVLGDDALVDAALERARWVAAQPFASPDLYNGTAGRLRFHLWLWEVTREPEQLHAALAAGRALCGAAESVGGQGLCWTIPPGHGDLSGVVHLGYAHGAAGIADALLDLFEATGESGFLETARGAGRWLAGQALPALDDDSGRNWFPCQGNAERGAFWCHGAAGIGLFFLHAARMELLPEARELAERAARAVSLGTRWAGPVQCHGLAGNIEMLLDVFQATREEHYREEARMLGGLLETFAVEDGGDLVWFTETPGFYCPGFMVGYAGVAACLLRLAEPERRPHLLSGAFWRELPACSG